MHGMWTRSHDNSIFPKHLYNPNFGIHVLIHRYSQVNILFHPARMHISCKHGQLQLMSAATQNLNKVEAAEWKQLYWLIACSVQMHCRLKLFCTLWLRWNIMNKWVYLFSLGPHQSNGRGACTAQHWSEHTVLSCKTFFSLLKQHVSSFSMSCHLNVGVSLIFLSMHYTFILIRSHYINPHKSSFCQIRLKLLPES